MPLHYVNDGGGRDGYIRTNNGGFSVASPFGKPGPSEGEMQLPGGGPQARIKQVPTTTRPFHYNQDGSGRDSYVYAAHHCVAQLSPQGRRAKESFYNQLR